MGAEKMSKSLGNIVTPSELLAQGHKGETLRLALLSAHYRQPLAWTESVIAQSKATLDRWYRSLAELNTWPAEAQSKHDARPREEVLQALRDDLNTPLAISRLDRILKSTVSWNLVEGFQHLNDATFQAVVTARLLGFLTMSPDEWFRGEGDTSSIEERIAARAQAKKNRDFARADKIRDELKAEGILLEDSPSGTTWRRE
jgi:cysteinyl-tRNA synthetase